MKKYSDSTLKGFTKDFLIKTIRCLENNLEDCEYRNENQFRILCQMDLERAKYGWHDLRKDPNDLPKPLDNSIMYDCVLENHIYDASYPSFYFDDDTKQFGEWNSGYAIANGANEFITVDELGYEKVIAWKEIEPFEELEE